MSHEEAMNPELTTTSLEEENNDEQRLSNWLVDQMNRKYPGYTPRIIDPSQLPRHAFDTSIGNIWTGGLGKMTCDRCIVHTSSTDETLWQDIKRHTRFVITIPELQIAPDGHQCFCGFLSIRPENLESHLAMSPPGAAEEEQRAHTETITGLLDRFKRVLMHDGCWHQLEKFVIQHEYVRRSNQKDVDLLDPVCEGDDMRITIDHI